MMEVSNNNELGSTTNRKPPATEATSPYRHQQQFSNIHDGERTSSIPALQPDDADHNCCDEDDDDDYIIRDESLVSKRPIQVVENQTLEHASFQQNDESQSVDVQEERQHPLVDVEITKAFDPYNPSRQRPSLLDDDDNNTYCHVEDDQSYTSLRRIEEAYDEDDTNDITCTIDTKLSTPRNVAAVDSYLEMEAEDSPRTFAHQHQQPTKHHAFNLDQQPQNIGIAQYTSRTSDERSSPFEDPIQTTSGLLLTHRRVFVGSSSSTGSSNQNISSNNSKRPISATTDKVRYPYSDGDLQLKPYDLSSLENPRQIEHHHQLQNNNRLLPQHAHQQAMFNSPLYLNKKTDFVGTDGNIKNADAAHFHYLHKNISRKPERLEFDSAGTSSACSNRRGNHPDPHWTFLHQLGRTLSFVRVWVILSAVVLLVGTLVIIKHTGASRQHSANENDNRNINSIRINSNGNGNGASDSVQKLDHNSKHDTQLVIVSDSDTEGGDRIVLLPLPDYLVNSHIIDTSHSYINVQNRNHQHQYFSPPHRRLSSHVQGRKNESKNMPQHDHHVRYTRRLRAEFDSWMEQHSRNYSDTDEKEYRFLVWSHNHHRTIEKNEKHGACKMTGKAVFGSNHFKDLTEHEFKTRYLTGYTGPRTDEEPKDSKSSGVLGPHIATTRHESIHRRYLEKFHTKWFSNKYNSAKESYNDAKNKHSAYGTSVDCEWYDVSCLLQFIFGQYFYGWGGTMEPAYDADSYPMAVDWREIGAVSDVRSQGNCGACWAITAVETVESANYIATGKMYVLSETEVIVCAEDCEMCAGGWPQDAFEYIVEQGGVPLRSDMTYKADWLVKVSDAIAGDSDELSSSIVKSFLAATCPNKQGGSADNHGSRDESFPDDDQYASQFTTNNHARYGSIKGYGYATKKCVCYTNGSGCDCASQNEGYAVRNLATYGPAVVCLDASTWQDYSSGIITPESGCSSGFMDVNHCVQAVGYAFYENDDTHDGGGGGGGGHEDEHNSHSGDNKEGSRDSSQRDGYWIIRNQWSTYWGMNGYAYVAMGSNTCGILNDMVQVYT